MQSDGSNTAMSPVAHGDIALSVSKIQKETFVIKGGYFHIRWGSKDGLVLLKIWIWTENIKFKMFSALSTNKGSVFSCASKDATYLPRFGVSFTLQG